MARGCKPLECNLQTNECITRLKIRDSRLLPPALKLSPRLWIMDNLRKLFVWRPFGVKLSLFVGIHHWHVCDPPSRIAPNMNHVDRNTCLHHHKNTCMYYEHSTCAYYDHSTCMYFDHSTSMHYDDSTCIYYDHRTCMYNGHGTRMFYDQLTSHSKSPAWCTLVQLYGSVNKTPVRCSNCKLSLRHMESLLARSDHDAVTPNHLSHVHGSREH